MASRTLLLIVLSVVALTALVVLQWFVDLQQSERTLLFVLLIVAGVLVAGYALKRNLE